eukprot:3828141-Prymnesium_polylepis.1
MTGGRRSAAPNMAHTPSLIWQADVGRLHLSCQPQKGRGGKIVAIARDGTPLTMDNVSKVPRDPT